MPLTVGPRVIESAQGGSEALEELIAAVWPEAYRLALVILRDRGLAEDAAQEACAAIARSLTSLKSWMPSRRGAIRSSSAMPWRRPAVAGVPKVSTCSPTGASNSIEVKRSTSTMRSRRLRRCNVRPSSFDIMPA